MKIYNQISQWMKIKAQDNEKIEDKNVLEYKILVVGDKGVGKSSVCMRFAMNEFNLEIKQNTQCECYPKTLKIFDQLVRIYLIDVDTNILNNQNQKPQIFAESIGAIIVYDVTKIKSFESVEKWYEEIKKNVGKEIPTMILGNKKDLNFLVNIDKEEGKEKANVLKACAFYEVSCTDLSSIKEAVKYLVANIYYEGLSEEKKEQFKKELSQEKKEAP